MTFPLVLCQPYKLGSRRDFLRSGGSVLGVSWLAMNSSLILAACQTARSNLEAQAIYQNITGEQAVELGAVVDQIIPEDETPGATQTGVVYFIDVALGGFMSAVAPLLKQGLDDLQQKTITAHSAGIRFSELSFAQQTSILKAVEDTQFFGTVHFLTMCGMFSPPGYGGNRDATGWELLSFDHQHAWQPPFGHYDAAVHTKGDDNGRV